MTSSLQAVHDLQERFRHNLDRYCRADYNETQVRREFIDPLFIALGWDVGNVAGYAPQYQEVVHEASQRGVGPRGGVVTPDYAFRVGPERKFLVEAKKPSVDLRHDPAPAFQLRRYAWSARLPLSILTNFRELAVYDCRPRPSNSDAAATARVLYFTFDEYAARWDELASVFGHEAVRRGDFDRFAENTRVKRGTQAVDDAFLEEIEGWRVLLARNVALRNATERPYHLGVREINYAVQKIIDRLIFLRICEDRGIEPYGQLRDALAGGDVYPRLIEIFRRADDRYNSGLFHFGDEPDRGEGPDTLTVNLQLDDRVFREIIGKLYYPDSPYDFAVISAEILGNVYERFLGSVIRLTPSHRAVVETKPEVRKAGGVYYTPQYIVEYIVEHTLGPLLENKTPGQAARLRILDPACGSGSFLLGAFDYLLRWHLDWYTSHPTRQARPELYPGPDGQPRLTTAEKKRILLNNLYGVDIDPQAVEVTKLSLLLKVLENETSDTLQMEMFQERALPDLGHNIKCGNSLIGSDSYHGQQMGMFDEDEWYRVNPFDWDDEFAEIMAGGGFDAVIGNPPYIRIQHLKEFAPQEAEHYKDRYVSASKGNYDIYVVFVEKGLSLLNAQGRLGYILPHKFFNAQYGEALRRMLAEDRYLSEIVHFGDQQVFDQATTYTCLLFLDKAGSEQTEVQRVTDLEAWQRNRAATAGQVPAERITAAEWNLVVGSGADLFYRLSEMPTTLGDVAQRIFQGIITGCDPVFLLTATGEGSYASEATEDVYSLEPELLHPLCKGSVDLRRYAVGSLAKYVLFPYRRVDSAVELIDKASLAAHYPETWTYLRECRGRLEARERGKWRTERWYAFSRNQNLDQMAQRKIMTPSIARRPSFTLDQSAELFFVGSGGGGGGGYGITIDSEVRARDTYFLGLLNSSIMRFQIERVSTPYRGGYYAYNRQYIESFPIRTIDWDDPADVARHDRMVALVERMLALQRERVAAEGSTPHRVALLERQIEATDREIDALVYELYDLTSEEIRIVEEGA